jgi:hypothetical protein
LLICHPRQCASASFIANHRSPQRRREYAGQSSATLATKAKLSRIRFLAERPPGRSMTVAAAGGRGRETGTSTQRGLSSLA